MSKNELDNSWSGVVTPAWTDYNGHLNVRYFLWIFDDATHPWYETLGLGQPYRERTNHTTFAVQCHISYQREGREGEAMEVGSQILGYDDKRLHYFKTLYNVDGDYQMATFEQLCVHVDLSNRKVVPWPAEIVDNFAKRFETHSKFELPKQVGNVMGVKSNFTIVK